MIHYSNFISRQEARKIQQQNSWLKLAVAILAIVAGFALAFAHNYHTQLRMNSYAIENDCVWNYSYYINEQPVCK